MDEVFETLQSFPEMGVAHRALGRGVRVFTVDRRWNVIYRVTEAVEIVRVVDARIPLLSTRI